MAKTDSNQYPERLGVCMIINAPSALSYAWSIIKAFLDDVTKAKIKIFSNPKDWQPELFNLIGKSILSRYFSSTYYHNYR